ncbi:MAG: T9SS C-terminal target domain-containing protein, partial [Bacteroidetes bacterium]
PVCDEGGEVVDCYEGPACDGPGYTIGNFPACDDSVCSYDPFCCDISWDSICEGEAAADPNCFECTFAGIAACGGGGNGGGPDDNDGDCCSANGTPGCEYNDCEAIVCGIDPFCCDISWDGICAGEAEDFCGGLCNGGLMAEVGNEEETIEDGNTEKVDNLVLFPNPSAGQINIAVEDFMGESVAMTITNTMGQRVWIQRIDVLETSRIAVDLTDSRYPSGVYYMTMYVNDAVLTKQFVLSK